VSHLLTPGKFNTWMRPAATVMFLAYVLALALGRPVPAAAVTGRTDAGRASPP